jgi:hypothetical protein
LTIKGFAFYSIILTIVMGLIVIENSFQNSYASSKTNSIDFTSLLPFNSHIADQAKDEKASSINSLPFP